MGREYDYTVEVHEGGTVTETFTNDEGSTLSETVSTDDHTPPDTPANDNK
jgi:hypothetical protein